MSSADDEDQPATIPEWVVTYGDMMSLLLTFFIMLVSLSEIKQEEKFQALVESMRRTFGHDSSPNSLAPGKNKPRTAKLARNASEGRAQRLNLMNGGDKVKAPVGDDPRVRSLRSADNVTIGGGLVFDHTSANLTEDHKAKLRTIADQLRGKSQRVEVRGHTSKAPLPPGSGFRDHWDLSYTRARKVMDYLIELGIKAERIRISAAADAEPVHTKPDPVLQKENDRVDVYLLNELTDLFDGTDGKQNSKYLIEPRSL